MAELSLQSVAEAQKAIASMIGRAQKAQEKFEEGSSWYTLQRNRIKALCIASALIAREMGACDEIAAYSSEDLEKAAKPLASMISKSEKAQQKLALGTWQHTMLDNHLKALRIASPLLARALWETGAERE